MNAIAIRRARLTDADGVLKLAKDFATSFTVSVEAFRSTFPLLVEQEDALLLVAERAEGVVGYCLAFDHLTFFANGRVTWVEELAVNPNCRKAGIGRSLMNQVEAWALQRNSGLVSLATRRANLFYRAIGYEESAAYFRRRLDS